MAAGEVVQGRAAVNSRRFPRATCEVSVGAVSIAG